MFCRIHEPFYNISKILPSKKAFTYYENENTRKEFSFEALKQQCQEVYDILVMNLTCIGSPLTIGIYCDPGPSVLACILGILEYSSFIYLTPELTEPELMELIERVPIIHLIIDKKYFTKFSSLQVESVVIQECNIFSELFLLITLKPDNDSQEVYRSCIKYPLAYVMCTSGSTGCPKLVYVPHKCIVPNIKDFQKLFNVSEHDTILNLSPLTFDPSIIDIFLSLNYGGHLIILSPSIIKKPKILEVILENNPISIMQITPTLLGTLCPNFLRKYFSPTNKSLRLIALGGEVFPSQMKCSEWFTSQCRIKVFNLYGLTELSCWASCQEVNISRYLSDGKSLECSSVPLGIPLTGTNLYLADNFGNKLSQGNGNIIISGERNICYISGDQMSQQLSHVKIKTGDIGYTDGANIFYVERSDNIIKRNACKVGLSEIEVVSKLLAGVSECCAVSSENEIHLFVSLTKSSFINEQSLQMHLQRHLSSWKLPNKICILEKLPINRNGKIDRQKLIMGVKHTNGSRVLSEDCSQKNENSTETMFQLWREFLHGYIPEESDNFISLGGNSIQAVHLSEKIQDIYSSDSSLILQTLLNKTFKDICSLVQDTEILPSVDRNYDHTDTKLKLKRKYETMDGDDIINNLPLSYDKSSTNPISVYYVCRRGHYNNGKRLVSTLTKNIETLNINWKISLDKCIDSSPLLVELDNQIRLFIGSHSHKFVCLDVSGKELWTIMFPDRLEASACPSNDGKVVYIGCYNGNLYCVDVHKGKEQWKVSTEGTVKSTAAVDPETGWIVFGSYDKYLYCCSAAGQIVWKRRLSNGSIFSSPVIKDNLVYSGTLDGYLTCLSLKEGNLKWKKLIGKPIFSSLATYSSGIVFGCTDSIIYCLGYDSEVLWKYKTNGPIFSSPFILEYKSGVLIAIGSHDHSLYLLDNFGTKIASIKFSSPVYSTPFIVFNKGRGVFTVVASETNGEIHVFELQLSDGLQKLSNLNIRYKVNGELFSSPIFHNDMIYVGCRDNYLYCLHTY